MAVNESDFASYFPPQAPQAGEFSPEIMALAQQLNVDPRVVQEAMFAGRFDEVMRGLEQRQQYADLLRTEAGPEGRRAGGVYMAANPLEHAASALRSYYGGREARNIAGEREEALDRQDRAAAATAEMELRARDEILRYLRGGPYGDAGQPRAQPQPQAQPAPTNAAPPPAPAGTTAPPVNAPPPPAPGGVAPPPQAAAPQAQQGPPLPPGAVMALRNRQPRREQFQGPPEPGWWDQNPARLAAKRRLQNLVSFPGLLRKS